jgi:hypothetical protein
MKELLTTAPVLAQPDIDQPFDVYCDASVTSIGGVLMQGGRHSCIKSMEALSLG